MPSKSQIKALTIVRKRGKGLRASDFALEMWPDSRMHTKVSNQGNGACRGKAGWLCGGAYLRRLEKEGLIKEVLVCSGDWILTDLGKEVLSAD